MSRFAGIGCVLAVLACRPTTRGQCAASTDCADGLSCSATGVCVAASGTCDPACGTGQLCVAGACTALQPVVTVTLPSGATLSPQSAQVPVHLEIAPTLLAGSLVVQALAGSTVLASGRIDSPVSGDSAVPLTTFATDAVGQVAVVATLAVTIPDAGDQQVSSPAVGAFLDAQGPAVSIFQPAGWVPKTASDNVEVRAQLDDGAGTGPASATLTLDACPATLPCSYDGVALDAHTFSIQVPRAVQADGSEVPVPFHVAAKDKAGNVRRVTGALQIDAAPPAIGALTALTAGVVGEDGNTWFQGGPGAPDVVVAIPITDASGLSSVSGTITQGDVVGTTGLTAQFPNPDGTVHFTLPASAVHNREGKLRFSVTATDAFGHSAQTTQDALYVLVDAEQPQPITVSVGYASASPAGVCGGQADSATFVCGRNATQLLREDQAPVTFSVTDCGAGVGAVSATSGPTQVTPTELSKSQSGACFTHNYAFTFNSSLQAPTLGALANNVASVAITATGADRTHNSETGSTSANVAVYRWKASIGSAATGAPALLPGSAPRVAVVGTDGAIFAFKSDGTSAWTAAVPKGVGADLGVDDHGSIYAVSGDRLSNCTGSVTNHCGALTLVTTGSSGATVHDCGSAVAGSGFGAAPAIVTTGGVDLAVIAATGRDTAASHDAFLYEGTGGACTSDASVTVASTAGSFTGASAGAGNAFFSHGQGFTAVPIINNNALNTGSTASFNPTNSGAFAAPALYDGGNAATFWSVFPGTDAHLYRAKAATCTLNTPCWQNDSGFTAPGTGASVTSTPVFDGTTLYAADASGTVYAWSLSTGAAQGSVQATTTGAVSGPVLLQGGSALVVQSDGTVRVVTPSTGAATTVASLNATSVPVAPVLESRTFGSVAYVPDGNGWLWALHLNATPVAASPTAWTRPGRDSCNTRYTGATWCP